MVGAPGGRPFGRSQGRGPVAVVGLWVVVAREPKTPAGKRSLTLCFGGVVGVLGDGLLGCSSGRICLFELSLVQKKGDYCSFD